MVKLSSIISSLMGQDLVLHMREFSRFFTQ